MMHSRLLTMTAVVVAIAGTSSALRLRAQAPAASALPTFEVASVKPNTSGPQSLQRVDKSPGDRVTIINVPVRIVIQAAYRLDAAHLAGGPSWAGNDRFDINAKADAPTSQAQLELMLRTLLADRFKLVVHTETRDESTYALVIARSDRTLGPNLHPAAADCATLRAAAAARGAQPGPAGPCGNQGGIPPGTLTGRGLDSGQLAGFLSRFAGRRVVNKTGLTGNLDWELKWTPEQFQRPFDREPSIDPDGPSIFTAVQEQLGLKLEPQQDKGEFIVIDRVERPSED